MWYWDCVHLVQCILELDHTLLWIDLSKSAAISSIWICEFNCIWVTWNVSFNGIVHLMIPLVWVCWLDLFHWCSLCPMIGSSNFIHQTINVLCTFWHLFSYLGLRLQYLSTSTWIQLFLELDGDSSSSLYYFAGLSINRIPVYSLVKIHWLGVPIILMLFTALEYYKIEYTRKLY